MPAPVGTRWPAGPPCPAPAPGCNGRSHRAGATLATGTAPRGTIPAGTGQPGSARGPAACPALPRDPVFGVWATVVVFLVPRSHGQIALFALTRKPVTTCKSSGMDSDRSPGLPCFQRLFIAQQNLFCCGSEAEPECELELRGDVCVARGGCWVTSAPLQPQTPRSGSLLPHGCPAPALPSSSGPGELEGSSLALKMRGLRFWGGPEWAGGILLGRGCGGKATSAEGHIVMAMGRGQAEVVLSPGACPPGRVRGHQATPEGSHLQVRGHQPPSAPPEQQSLGTGREVKTDYESVSLLCF